MSFAEQIAVLDGLDVSTIDIDDGRIGQEGSQVDEYGHQIMPGVLVRRHVIDPSEGANYSGGSDYAPGLPLLPSSVGLAGFANIPNVLPTRRHVIDYSGGANYSGGSDYVPGLPLLPSSAGLAMGGVDVNAPTIQGGYGAAGLGNAMGTAADQDLAGAFNGLDALAEDGRIGQTRAQVDEYGRPVMPGVISRGHVIDASEGANYSGGSSYGVGLPLLPSSIGLAGVAVDAPTIQGGYGAAGLGGHDALNRELAVAAHEFDPLDGLSDAHMKARLSGRARSMFNKMASASKLRSAKKQLVATAKVAVRTPSPRKRLKLAAKVRRIRARLRKARMFRRGIMARGMTGGVMSTASLPFTPSRPYAQRPGTFMGPMMTAVAGSVQPMWR